MRGAGTVAAPDGHARSNHLVVRDHRNRTMVMKQVTATRFKAECLALLDEAASGEEIVVTKDGRPVALVMAAEGPPIFVEAGRSTWTTKRSSSRWTSTGTPTRDHPRHSRVDLVADRSRQAVDPGS